jgi:hypothetical protein
MPPPLMRSRSIARSRSFCSRTRSAEAVPCARPLMPPVTLVPVFRAVPSPGCPVPSTWPPPARGIALPELTSLVEGDTEPDGTAAELGAGPVPVVGAEPGEVPTDEPAAPPAPDDPPLAEPPPPEAPPPPPPPPACAKAEPLARTKDTITAGMKARGMAVHSFAGERRPPAGSSDCRMCARARWGGTRTCIVPVRSRCAAPAAADAAELYALEHRSPFVWTVFSVLSRARGKAGEETAKLLHSARAQEVT